MKILRGAQEIYVHMYVETGKLKRRGYDIDTCHLHYLNIWMKIFIYQQTFTQILNK